MHAYVHLSSNFQDNVKKCFRTKKTIQIGAAIKSYTANKMTENKIDKNKNGQIDK